MSPFNKNLKTKSSISNIKIIAQTLTPNKNNCHILELVQAFPFLKIIRYRTTLPAFYTINEAATKRYM